MAVENLPYIHQPVEENQAKTVTLEIPNPEHPQNWGEWDEEMMLEFFEAAQWAVQTLGKDRNVIVGHFLRALEQLEKEEEVDELVELFQMLTEDVPQEELQGAWEDTTIVHHNKEEPRM